MILSRDAIPTEFWVDCIEVDEYFDLVTENERLNASIAKMKLDSEEVVTQMQNKIDRLTAQQAAEMDALKMAQIELKSVNWKLEEELQHFKQCMYTKVSGITDMLVLNRSFKKKTKYCACKRRFSDFKKMISFSG